jgi:hypothetical protein
MSIVTEYDWESDTYSNGTSGHTNGTSAPAPTTGASEWDEGLDTLYAWYPPQAPAPAPLPEAAFSLTLRGTLGGVEALLTARGQTAAEFKANLAAIRGILDASTPAPVQTPTATQDGEGWCAVHETAMKMHHGKDGRSWFSHALAEGGWCKGHTK